MKVQDSEEKDNRGGIVMKNNNAIKSGEFEVMEWSRQLKYLQASSDYRRALQEAIDSGEEIHTTECGCDGAITFEQGVFGDYEPSAFLEPCVDDEACLLLYVNPECRKSFFVEDLEELIRVVEGLPDTECEFSWFAEEVKLVAVDLAVNGKVA